MASVASQDAAVVPLRLQASVYVISALVYDEWVVAMYVDGPSVTVNVYTCNVS